MNETILEDNNDISSSQVKDIESIESKGEVKKNYNSMRDVFEDMKKDLEKKKEVQTNEKKTTNQKDDIEESSKKEETKETKETKEVEDKKSKVETHKEKIPPPATWSKEEKKGWDELPEHVQKAALRVEKESQREGTKLLNEVKKLTSSSKPFLEFEERIKEVVGLDNKKNTIEYLEDLVRADIAARENPPEYVKSFIKNKNIDLQALAQGNDHEAFDLDYYQQNLNTLKLQRQIQALEENLAKAQEEREIAEYEKSVAPLKIKVDNFTESLYNNYTVDQIEAASPYLAQKIQQLAHANPEASADELLSKGWELTIQALKIPRIGSFQNDNHQKVLDLAQKGASLKARSATIIPKKYNSLSEIAEEMRNEIRKKF